jgi:hypothetical protein
MGNRVYVGPAQCKVDVKEKLAAATILPGQVVRLNAGAFALAGADQDGLVYFAGNNILGERDQAHATGDTVQGYRPSSGEYYDLVLAASQTIAEDAALTTNASGNLVALGGGTNVIAYAAEAKTTGAGGTGVIRVYVK